MLNSVTYLNRAINQLTWIFDKKIYKKRNKYINTNLSPMMFFQELSGIKIYNMA